MSWKIPFMVLCFLLSLGLQFYAAKELHENPDESWSVLIIMLHALVISWLIVEKLG